MRRFNKMIKKCFTRVLIASLLISMTGCKQKEDVTDAKITVQETTQAEITSEEEVTSEETKDNAEGFMCLVKSNNSWESGEYTCAQFEGKIKNLTNETKSDWKITITIPNDSKLETGWNGKYQIDGNTLTITPEDYNKEIQAKGEVDFGFIMDTKGAFSPEEGSLVIDGNNYAINATGELTTASVKEDQTEEEKESETTESKNEVATKDMTGTPVGNHGALAVKGTDIVDKDGKVFQLKGVSTHGIGWFPDYVSKDTFASLSEYGVNAIRLAMYTAEGAGYCTGGDPTKLESLVEQGVDACTQLGLYVIIDWHVLQDLDPNVHKDKAKEFFEKMSKKYANNENVIYEICNEPNGGTSWDSVKAYAEEIIPVIRKNDKKAIIIVGTPNWSQDVDVASANPITNQENIMYAVHFYASTHKQDIRNKVEIARKNGSAIIVSECSICEASGNGSINYEEAEEWMKMINDNHLSVFCWNLSNKDEQSSILKSSVSKTSGFTMDDFSDTGKWFMEHYSK